MQTVIVLCTGNSCRSIMAEALINQLGKGRYQAYSAGSFPTGSVHPKAIEILIRYGITLGHPHSKSWDAFSDRSFDLLITVCDQAANESCPSFLSQTKKLHWSTPDPVKVSGTEEMIETAFIETFQILKNRIEKELLSGRVNYNI